MIYDAAKRCRMITHTAFLEDRVAYKYLHLPDPTVKLVEHNLSPIKSPGDAGKKSLTAKCFQKKIDRRDC